MSSEEQPTLHDEGRRRVAPVVALALLEVIRDQDLPGEVLADEDVTLTLPRRLGLSDVIEAQIRRYREDMKRRRRVSDGEVRDLLGLVVRRPDSDDVFRRVGRRLAGIDRDGPGWRAVLPRRVAFALARRRARRRLKALFGRGLGEFVKGPFDFEARDDLLIAGDPGGEACLLLSGLLSAILERYTGHGLTVMHQSCRARQGDVCRWVSVEEEVEEPREPEGDATDTADATSEVA